MSLRSASEIPFLGKQPVNEILGAKLPTKLLIFCHFFYHHKELSKNSTDAIHATAKSVVTCWEKAGCKTKKIDGIKNDIKKWFTMHQVFDAHAWISQILISYIRISYHLHANAVLNVYDPWLIWPNYFLNTRTWWSIGTISVKAKNSKRIWLNWMKLLKGVTMLRNSLKTRCYYGLWHWKYVSVEIIVLFLIACYATQ